MVERTLADVVATIEAGEFYSDYDQSVADLGILRKALATQEAEPGLIDEIHELAGMVGATFTPHEKPTPEAEPVASEYQNSKPGEAWNAAYPVSQSIDQHLRDASKAHGAAVAKNMPLVGEPSITDAEVEVAQAVLNERIFDDGGVTNAEIPGMVRDMLTAFLKARRQG